MKKDNKKIKDLKELKASAITLKKSLKFDINKIGKRYKNIK